jgi:hypothetical protein
VLRTWNPKESGQYTADARELARNLIYAGCSAGKVDFAVKSCARTFGIQIRGRKFMGRRTAGRAVDEGGKYGEIQLAREIMDAPGICLVFLGTVALFLLFLGFVESSDGTTHRGITVESRHVTLLAPSYEPGDLYLKNSHFRADLGPTDISRFSHDISLPDSDIYSSSFGP